MDIQARGQLRQERSRAFRALVRAVAEVDLFRPTPASLFECLSTAREQESSAATAIMLRAQAFNENDAPPTELSAETIACYLARAAELYATAASKCLRIPDLGRAYRYYRRAANQFCAAANWETAQRFAWAAESRQNRGRADALRQIIARQQLCRHRWTLGLLRRGRC